MMRLNKYLADCGLNSRRKCDALIASGQVTVNDVQVTKLGIKIDETVDQVKVGGREVSRSRKLDYIVLNKPKGYITTRSDERGRKTVFELVGNTGRLFPVGRLDKDTTGLLLLTNDGELAYRLTHPKFGVEKTYEVVLDKDLSNSDRAQLENGVRLDEGRTSKATISYLNQSDKTRVRMTMHQGWKRQIRRMFAQLGYEVLHLSRIRLGTVSLGDLKPGAWRRLSGEEVASLRGGLESGN